MDHLINFAHKLGEKNNNGSVCVPIALFANRDDQANFEEIAFYSLLGPSILVLMILSILQQRTSKKTFKSRTVYNFLHSQGGVPVPMYFFDGQVDRVGLVAAFGMAFSLLLSVVWKSTLFYWMSGDITRYTKAFETVWRSVTVSLKVYPLVATISTRHAMAYLFGTVYALALTTILVLTELPCIDDAEVMTIYLLIDMIALFPVVVCVSYILVTFPLNGIRTFLSHWRASRNRKYSVMEMLFTPINETAERSREKKYVIRLFNMKKLTSKSANVTEPTKLEKLKQAFWDFGSGWHVPHVRVSMTMMLAVSLSILLIFAIMVALVAVYIVFVVDYLVDSSYEYFFMDDGHNLTLALENIANYDSLLATGTHRLMHKFKLFGTVAEDVHDNQSCSYKLASSIFSTPLVIGLDLSNPELRFWRKSLKVLSTVVLGVVWLSTCLQLLHSIKRYNHHMAQMRRGIIKNVPQYYKSWPPKKIITYAVRFIGYQIAYTIWGFFWQSVICTLLLLIVYVLVAGCFRYELWALVGCYAHYLIPTIVGIATALFMNQAQKWIICICFVARHENGQEVLLLDNRRWYYNFQFLMIFNNLALGLMSSIVRLILGALVGILLLPRIDLSTLPQHLTLMDAGFASYVCMLCIEHTHTHPVMVCSCEVLQALANDRAVQRRQLTTTSLNPQQQHTLITQLITKNRIRNKWLLLITLANNPSLCKLRDREGPKPSTALQPSKTSFTDKLRCCCPKQKLQDQNNKDQEYEPHNTVTV